VRISRQKGELGKKCQGLDLSEDSWRLEGFALVERFDFLLLLEIPILLLFSK
jgi:hypothetical protein